MKRPKFVLRQWDTGIEFEGVEWGQDWEPAPSADCIRILTPPDADKLDLTKAGVWFHLDRARVEWLRDVFTHWLETQELPK